MTGAKDTELGRDVAIKVPRWARETQVLASPRHGKLGEGGIVDDPLGVQLVEQYRSN